MDREHQNKLRQLGLANDDDDVAPIDQRTEIEQILAESERYQGMYQELEVQIEQLLGQIEDCENTKRFLQTAIDAAEKDDVAQCEQETEQVLEQQRSARLRTDSCVQQLADLSDSLPMNRRMRIARFIGTDTTSARQPIDTTIQLE